MMKIYLKTPSRSKFCQDLLLKKAKGRGMTKILDLDIHLNREGLSKRLIAAQFWIQVIKDGLSNNKDRLTNLRSFKLVIRNLCLQTR